MKHMIHRALMIVSVLVFILAFISGAHAQSPSTQPLSFSQAYLLIQQRNLSVQSQNLNVETSRARRLLQVGNFTPKLALVGTDQQQGLSPRAAASQTSDFVERRQTAALALSANLFRSGADLAGLKAANHDLDADRESLTNEKLKAEEDAVASLVEVITRTQSRDFIVQIVKIKQEAVQIARERFNKGLLAAQEVDKTQIDLDNAAARLTDADVALASAKASVAARLGTSQSLDIVWPWKSAISAGQQLEASSFALESRPDYRSAVESLEAADWRRHASRANLLPSLDLTASYGNADLNQADRRDWSTVLTLTIPLFEGFTGWSASRIQSLEKQQAEIRREVIARTAKAELDSLSVGFRAARESAVAREKTSKLTARLFADNLQRFRLGRASVNELAFDQNRLLESQILEVEGWSTAHLSFVRLCHALGRTVQANGVCESLK